ncbi:hypothetical protein [Pseudoteredinibacter isoporae]|uniref:Transcriptional regulator SutA RNAP-binding domain-containing protein n=1 Tax=Pseudoteredinibacter isoporae TaxID=570281 RepID=A0A7X0JRB9_9GAMM|nr:hypothetical protein [Pseudoteredinibacter isoporae]MBB6519971.1 hypothetical protein [Pseudoteredinibacter isoporae]NHO85543.1 hypothetical protein [Pseudoteredinibacter isoporae]NIB26005.1 hypothetical protein [Pseudoteredinibacter isoporae]
MTVLKSHKKGKATASLKSGKILTGGLESLAKLDREHSFTPKCREGIREELERQVQEFLMQGGEIQGIAPDVMADPPRKPQSKYGSRPI